MKPRCEQTRVEPAPGLAVAAGYRVEVGRTGSAPFGFHRHLTTSCAASTVAASIPPQPPTKTEQPPQADVAAGCPYHTGLIEVLISGPQGQRTIRAPAICARSIAFLGPDPVSERTLLDALPSQVDEQARLSLCSILEALACAGALRRVVIGAGDALALVEPLGEHYRFTFSHRPNSEQLLRLVRFSLLRPDGERMVLESPLSHARVWILQPAIAAVVASLASARPVSSLGALNLAANIPERCLLVFLSLLIAEGFIVLCEPGAASGDELVSLRHWEFHDLLFHTRSRRGRHGNVVGASFRFRGKTAPPPATKLPMSLHRIPLQCPDMGALFLRDMPLTAALEQRTSVRERAQRSISFQELGEFLYRCARVRQRGNWHELELTS